MNNVIEVINHHNNIRLGTTTAYANGIMVETADERHRHIDGFYTWPYVFPIIAVIAYKAKINRHLRLIEQCCEDAEELGATECDLEAFLGKDCDVAASFLRDLVIAIDLVADSSIHREVCHIIDMDEGGLEVLVATYLGVDISVN